MVGRAARAVQAVAVGNPSVNAFDGGVFTEASALVASVWASDSGTGTDATVSVGQQATYLATIQARSGLVWAGMFDGVSAVDASGGGHGITWYGSPGTRPSPLPNDPKVAGDLATSNVGAIAHFAALDFGNGPWAIEFWCTGHDQNSVLFSLTDDTSTGWAIQSTAGIMQLTSPTTVVNIQASAASSAGWHHFVVSRGPGTNGHIYVDGVDRTQAVNPITFASTAQQLELLANGGLYGVAIYNRELSAGEAMASATYAYPSAGGAGLPAIQGYGKDALSSLGTETYTVSNTNTSGAGSFMGAMAWLNAGHSGTVIITASGSVALPNAVTRVNNASNFLIDGRQGSLTLTGGCLFFYNCHHYAVVNIRHRGGWSPSRDSGAVDDQDADCFTNGSCHDYAYVNVSFSGWFDEGLDIAYPSYNITVQDCLWGPGGSVHNFGGGIGCFTTKVSMIRPVYCDVEYRAPRVEYWSTNLTGYSSPCWNGSNYDGGLPPDIIVDITNPIWIDCPVMVSSYGRGLNNVRTPDPINSGNGFTGSAKYGSGTYHVSYEVSTGGQSSDFGGVNSNPLFTVPSANLATGMTLPAARTYAKANSGCLPHDSFDTTQLARIP